MTDPNLNRPQRGPTFAQAGEVTLHYRLSGPRHAAHTLVFLNSLGSDFSIWDEVAASLNRQYHVLQYDKRGHGLSDATPAPYTMRDHSTDLKRLLDALGLEKVVLCGVSVGGMIAQDFAAAFPERTGGLVLCDTGMKIGTPETWNPRIQAAEDKDLDRVADAALARWFTPEFFAGRPAEVRGYRNMITRTSPQGYAGTCFALRDTDLTGQTRALKVPAMVVCGADDTSTPPELNQALADALGVPLQQIPHCAHIPSVEKPETVTRLIESFLAALEGAGQRYDAGMRVRRSVLGDAHVDRASGNVSDLDRDFQTYITEYAWGGPWSRGVLDTHTRHLITLAVLTALPREHELEMHIRSTRNTGVTPEELREVFMHTAVYAGVPVANRALQIAKQVLADVPAQEEE